MGSLGVFVVTQNAAKTLPRVLEGLAWADDLTVVDLGSTDETLTIANAADRTVMPWPGPPPPIVELVRKQLLERGGHEWFLFVDQDEVHVDTREAIESHILSSSTAPLAFRFRHFALGHEVTGLPAATRLIHASHVMPADIHEPTAAAVAEHGHIDHLPITSLREWVRKWRRYAAHEASTLAASDWQLALGRDLVKAPIAQVKQTLTEGRDAWALAWGLHAAVWVAARPVMAVRRRGSLRPARLGGLRERPWGWGEQTPTGYLRLPSRVP